MNILSKFNKIFGHKKKEGNEKEEREKSQIKRAKEEVTEKKYEINIAYDNIKNLENFINEKIEKGKTNCKESAQQNLKNCLNYIEKIKIIVSSMDDNIPKMNKRFEKIIMTNKKEFTKRILSIDIKKQDDFEQMRKNILEVAQFYGNTDIEYGRTLSYAYPQMEEFRRELKKLVDEIAKLNTYNYERYEEYNKFKEYVEKYNKEKEIIANFEFDLKNKIKEKEDDEKELKNLINSKEYLLLNKHLEESKKILNEKEEIGSKIHTKIASMSRILRKIRSIMNIKEIDLYLKEPKIFVERDNNEILSILQFGKKIDLNDDEIRKIGEFERSFYDLITLKEKYLKILDNEKVNDAQIRKIEINKKKEILEERIKRKSNEIIKKTTEIDKLKEKNKKTKSDIFETKKELENKLGIVINIDNVEKDIKNNSKY